MCLALAKSYDASWFWPKTWRLAARMCLGGERLVANHPATQGANPLAEKIGEGSPARARDGNDLSAGGGQLAGKPADGIVPGDLLELPVGTAGHRSLEPAWVVEPLERRLTRGSTAYPG